MVSNSGNHGAGVNERKNGGIFADWEQTFLNNGTPGSVTQLDQPANTIILTNGRTELISANADYLGYQCTQNGLPASPNSFSCIQSTKNRGLTAAFFGLSHLRRVSFGFNTREQAKDFIEDENNKLKLSELSEADVSLLP